MGSVRSPFIFNDAIIGLAQSLTEAVDQLASGLRRARDLIKELARRESFYLNLAGGPSGRASGTIFHNAHLTYELPCANFAEKDAVAIEFPEYLDDTADKAKNMLRALPLFEEDFSFSELLASHCGSLNQERVANLNEGKLSWKQTRGHAHTFSASPDEKLKEAAAIAEFKTAADQRQALP